MALLEGLKNYLVPRKYRHFRSQAKAAWLCLKDKKLPGANGGKPLHIPGKGSMSLLEGQKTNWCQRRTASHIAQEKVAWVCYYLVPTKYRSPQVPSEAGMALYEVQKLTGTNEGRRASDPWQRQHGSAWRTKSTWYQQRTAQRKYQAKAAGFAWNTKNYLVPTKDSAFPIRGEGSTALLEGQKTT
jgi:hypothetical protein